MKFRKEFIVDLISGLFILLFVYTAISKFAHIGSFQSALQNAPRIGKYAVLISYAIPTVELIVAGLLFAPTLKKWGLLFSLILMIIFTSYLFYMIFFSHNLPCSCGGVIEKMSWNQHLVFNCFFSILAGIGYGISRKIARP